MKKLILLLITLFTLNVKSQDDKEVTLTTLGTGASKEDAKNNALRSAIEQAFGTFVSSNTSVVNDELIKDEIINVSNGNIKKYTIISENMLPNNTWVVSLNATVSAGNLTKFCESKGIKVDFKGALFAANIKIMELNKNNEIKTIDNLFKICCEIIPKLYNYSLKISEPKKVNDYAVSDINIYAGFNDNIKILSDLVFSTFCGVSINSNELNNYKNVNVEYFPFLLLAYDRNQNNQFKYSKYENVFIGRKITYELDEVKPWFDCPHNYQVPNKKNGGIVKDANFLVENLNHLVFNYVFLRDEDSIDKIRYLIEFIKSHAMYFKISNEIESAFGFNVKQKFIENDTSSFYLLGVKSTFSQLTPCIFSDFEKYDYFFYDQQRLKSYSTYSINESSKVKYLYKNDDYGYVSNNNNYDIMNYLNLMYNRKQIRKKYIKETFKLDMGEFKNEDENEKEDEFEKTV
jgi:hypothetical protein